MDAGDWIAAVSAAVALVGMLASAWFAAKSRRAEERSVRASELSAVVRQEALELRRVLAAREAPWEIRSVKVPGGYQHEAFNRTSQRALGVEVVWAGTVTGREEPLRVRPVMQGVDVDEGSVFRFSTSTSSQVRDFTVLITWHHPEAGTNRTGVSTIAGQSGGSGAREEFRWAAPI